LKITAPESENYMSKYLAFIAALPLAVMPLPMVFMIISAIHDPGGVAEYGEASAIVRQEKTAPDVSTSDATLDKTRKIQFNTDRPKQLQKNPNSGRHDAYRRRRTHRRILGNPSERKQIVVPQGLNDAYAS
jgi:hypothetical protein